MDNIQPETSLTSREQEICDMLLAGKTPKEIAYELKIAYNTVISHQKSIYRKLNVQNFSDLFIKFRSSGHPATENGLPPSGLPALIIKKKKTALVFIALTALAIALLVIINPFKKTDEARLKEFMAQNDNNRRIFTALGWDINDSATWTSRGERKPWTWAKSEKWNDRGDQEAYIGIDWTANGKRISGIYFNNLGLTGTLDVSGFTALEILHCGNNQLASVNVLGCANLRELVCFENQLTDLDLTGLSALTELFCFGNLLTGLDLSKVPSIAHVNTSKNSLAGINLSGLSALEFLDVGANSLTRLDLSDLSSLTRLYCWINEISELDLTHNPLLTFLDCGTGNFTKYIFPDNSPITHLNCWNNELETIPPIENFSGLFWVVLELNHLNLNNEEIKRSLARIEQTIDLNKLDLDAMNLPDDWKTQAIESPEIWESILNIPYNPQCQEPWWDWNIVIGGITYIRQKM